MIYDDDKVRGNYQVGKTLSRHREDTGLSLRKVAEAVGISTTYLWECEKGLKELSFNVARLLADFYSAPDILLVLRYEKAVEYLDIKELFDFVRYFQTNDSCHRYDRNLYGLTEEVSTKEADE